MFFIRLIPTLLDGSLDISGMFHVRAVHSELLYGAKIPFEYKTRGLHWRLDNFQKTEGSVQSEGLTKVLSFDFDARNKIRRASEEEKSLALGAFLKFFNIKKDEILVNHTPFGFHIYIFFNDYFAPNTEKWLKKLLADFRATLVNYALDCDSASFNSRRTMRFPGSLYVKPGRERRECIVEKSEMASFFSWLKFKKKFNKYKSERIPHADQIKKSVAEERLRNIQMYKKIDWQSIVGNEGDEWGGCRFIRWAYSAQKELNYYEWIAQLSLTARFLPERERAYVFAKKFSEQYPNFNEGEFALKFDEVLDRMFPASCRQIEQIWRQSSHKTVGCVTCPHRPLNLPLNIKKYSHSDTGFRVVRRNKENREIFGEIAYQSFTDFLVKEHGVFTEKDGSIYIFSEDKKCYIRKTKNEFNSFCNKFIHLGIKPTEIENLRRFFTHNQVFDLELENKKTEGLLFFKNGVLDVETRELKPYSLEKYKNTYCILFNYEPEATAPIYEELLNFAFSGKTSERNYFLKYICESLFTSENHIEKALILYGDGANGKSSLMNGIVYLFSDLNIITPLNFNFLKTDKTYAEKLRFARLGYVADTSGKILKGDISFLKQIISKELMSYRLPYLNACDFRPRTNLILGVNESLEGSEVSRGLFRRFTVLNFENTWPDEKKDSKYNEKLKAEGPGILNILVDAYHAFKSQPYPRISNKILKESMSVSNLIYAFFNKRISKRIGARVPRKDAWKKFTNFLYDKGTDLNRERMHECLFTQQFRRMIRGHYIEYKRSGVRGYLDMEIVDEDVEQMERNLELIDGIKAKTD